jgi:hypothetical protein
MRELRSNDDGFLDEALCALTNRPDDPGSKILLRMMLGYARTLDRLADPSLLSLRDAVGLARRMQALDQNLDARMVRHLPNFLAAPDDGSVGTRAIEILAAISDGTRIQAPLQSLIRHCDSRVRTKATRLAGRMNQNPRWLEQRLAERDAAVRASAVESFWGADSAGIRELFLAATRDDDPLVAGSGVVGLHRSGDLRSIALARALTSHADQRFRAAGACAMAETQDPRFLPTLSKMLEDSNTCVKQNALRASVRIRKRITALREQPALRVTVRLDGNALLVDVSGEEGAVTDLAPTAFVVGERARPVDIESVSAASPEPGYRVLLAAQCPAAARVWVYCNRGMGEGAVPALSAGEA